jgi:hypothetical protein
MIWLSQLEWAVPSGKAKIAWPWYTLIGTSATFLLAWVTRALARAR